jgi:hypothetical protein
LPTLCSSIKTKRVIKFLIGTDDIIFRSNKVIKGTYVN